MIFRPEGFDGFLGFYAGAALAAILLFRLRNSALSVAAKAAPTNAAILSIQKIKPKDHKEIPKAAKIRPQGAASKRPCDQPLAKVTSKALAVRTRDAASGNSSLMRSLSPPSIA